MYMMKNIIHNTKYVYIYIHIWMCIHWCLFSFSIYIHVFAQQYHVGHLVKQVIIFSVKYVALATQNTCCLWMLLIQSCTFCLQQRFCWDTLCVFSCTGGWQSPVTQHGMIVIHINADDAILHNINFHAAQARQRWSCNVSLESTDPLLEDARLQTK